MRLDVPFEVDAVMSSADGRMAAHHSIAVISSKVPKAINACCEPKVVMSKSNLFLSADVEVEPSNIFIYQAHYCQICPITAPSKSGLTNLAFAL